MTHYLLFIFVIYNILICILAWSCIKARKEIISNRDMENKSPNTKQPPSIKNNLPYVWDLVLKDIDEKDKMGKKKHGTRLQPHNGRDSLHDAYQEALDMVVYIRQAIYERDGK